MSESIQKEQKKPVFHIRVSGPEICVEAVATQVGEQMAALGYEVIEQGPLIPGRYKDEEGARVFLIIR